LKKIIDYVSTLNLNDEVGSSVRDENVSLPTKAADQSPWMFQC